jgi:hypothetical protein
MVGAACAAVGGVVPVTVKLSAVPVDYAVRVWWVGVGVVTVLMSGVTTVVALATCASAPLGRHPSGVGVSRGGGSGGGGGGRDEDGVVGCGCPLFMMLVRGFVARCPGREALPELKVLPSRGVVCPVVWCSRDLVW